MYEVVVDVEVNCAVREVTVSSLVEIFFAGALY